LSLRADEERVWVDAKINGKPVKLAFDSGAEISVLFRTTAERLGLRITNSLPGKKTTPGKFHTSSQTESCELSFGGVTAKAIFVVADLPAAAAASSDMEGVLGWPVFSQNIIRFDWLNNNCQTLDRVPESVSHWLKLNLRRNCNLLALEIPDKIFSKGNIIVDTGAEAGVALAPKVWKRWTATHPNRNRTIDALFYPVVGVVTSEEAWADELSFGPLTLHDVPVREATIAEMALDPSAVRATLGLTALKRLILVVDGRKGVAYLQPRKSPALPYQHNRAGVVFVPEDIEKSKYLTARVLKGTPAWEANVRDGDVLLKVDDMDPEGSDSCRRPSGTKIRLTLKRGDKEFQTEIVLRDLIGPDVAAKTLKEPPR
jgi:hypothetical protein